MKILRRNLRKMFRASVGVAIAMCSVSASAYEIATHALITEKSYQRSVLNPVDPNTVVNILGFDRLDLSNPLDTSYFDNQATSDNPLQYTRFQQPQEVGAFRTLIDAGHLNGATSVSDLQYRVKGWLMQGAIREDDNDLINPVTGNYFTQDKRDADPWGDLLRAGRHFYDPIYDRGFSYPLCSSYGCVRSPVWAIGTQNPLAPLGDVEDTTRRNHFSWVDARNNYWRALTLERYPNGGTLVDRVSSSVERQQRWATTIASLGHVIHLLQDGAQPQHTRNDSHAPPWASVGNNAPNGAAYEAFTDYRVTGNAGGFFNNPIRAMNDNLPSLSQLPTLVFGNYPIPMFSRPVNFFTTNFENPGSGDVAINARRGIIDFSNRNFFTTGSYPGFRECIPPGTSPCIRQSGPTYPLPENDVTDTSVYTAIQAPLNVIINGQFVMTTMYARKAVDAINPSYLDQLPAQFSGKTPIVSRSSFAFVNNGPDDIQTNLRFENFIYDADVLLPRAVAYSSGLINFFFRGRIKIEAPLDGLFAVTDHSIPHLIDAVGYPRCSQNTPSPISGDPPLCTVGEIYGFTRLRLKLRNDTTDVVESGIGTPVPQILSSTSATPGLNGPRLVAVARYHINPCYQPNLSGETVVDANGVVTAPTCATGNRRSYQEISVSKPAAVTAGDLNGSTSVPVSFDFSLDPIPVNATDLFVQVVYRGQLGEEADGIAVGSIDVREPSYFTLWNNSDYAGCNGAWTTQDGSGCSFGSGTVQRIISTARMCIGTQLLYTRVSTGGNGNITLGGSARLVALLDDQPHPTRGRLLVGVATTLNILNRSITGQIRQAPMEQVTPPSPYSPAPMFIKRGHVGSLRPMPFYLVVGADPQPANDMGALDVGNLIPSFAPVALPRQNGELSFPATPASTGSCTSASIAPYFEDEIQAAAEVQ